ncbi:mitochondrial carrier homolog 2-like isoform X2 [Ruditapes philippinarum]|uniref:mitochondrial carrier homolog 2-like isoform X2 n=1 Tax=Ruditapes philippinarum TaxID=129788 RepID=UPI00295C008C|nr:mitochondrial carrier homolog 2-like isoform X2 [Ruditapes philippinarum]
MVAPINFGTVALSQCVTALFHPIGHAKILIQLGHEPIPAKLGTNIFGKEYYYYPNILKYAGHIWTTDGFIGMYTGLLPRVLGAFTGTCTQNAVLEWLRQDEKKESEEEEEDGTDWIKTLCIKTGQETVAKCAAVISSQPFHVIMVRQIAQFVGGEKIYCGLFPAIGEIYHSDGIKGFFAGLTPRLLGEIIQIWASNLIIGALNKYVIPTKEAQSYVPLFVGLVVSNFTYPFTLVSNVMAVAGTELVAASPPNMKPYADWSECWKHLKETGNIKRGNSQFFRVDRNRVGKPLLQRVVKQAPFK